MSDRGRNEKQIQNNRNGFIFANENDREKRKEFQF